MKSCNVVIAGVGGQGILLLSDILGEASILAGFPVRGAEVHGMAQRGGSVEAYVRIGVTYGPKIPVGGADLLLAFEPLEAARYSPYLKQGGIAVVNTSPVRLSGRVAHPETGTLLTAVGQIASRVIADDFARMARELGSVKTTNVLILGVAAPFLPVGRELLLAALKKLVKPQFLELNLRALDSGLEYSAGHSGR